MKHHKGLPENKDESDTGIAQRKLLEWFLGNTKIFRGTIFVFMSYVLVGPEGIGRYQEIHNTPVTQEQFHELEAKIDKNTARTIRIEQQLEDLLASRQNQEPVTNYVHSMSRGQIYGKHED